MRNLIDCIKDDFQSEVFGEGLPSPLGWEEGKHSAECLNRNGAVMLQCLRANLRGEADIWALRGISSSLPCELPQEPRCGSRGTDAPLPLSLWHPLP